MFYDCSSLTSLDLSNFITSNVTNMNMMFSGCSSLTSLNLSNFDTSNVTNMDSMFYRCSSLTSLDLSNFDTSKVTNMDSMLYNCSSIQILKLQNFFILNITNVDNIFYECNFLSSIDLTKSNVGNLNLFSDIKRNISICINEYRTDFIFDHLKKQSNFNIQFTPCINCPKALPFYNFYYEKCVQYCHIIDFHYNKCIINYKNVEFSEDILFNNINRYMAKDYIYLYNTNSSIELNEKHASFKIISIRMMEDNNSIDKSLSECEAKLITKYNISQDTYSVLLLVIDIFFGNGKENKSYMNFICKNIIIMM